MTGHPSHYALDRAALGAPVDGDVAAHLGRCGRCAALVAERRAAPEPPAWVAGVKVRPPPPRRSWWRLLRWLVPVPALAAVAAALVVASLPRHDGDDTRAKGAPAVALYVKRGDVVSTWDGKRPLRPGDRLRVGVRGSGFAQISVASVSPSGVPSVLYTGPVEREGETLLPLGLRVEGGGAAEVLSVILAMRPIPAAEHATAARAPRQRGVWAIRLHIPKEDGP